MEYIKRPLGTSRKNLDLLEKSYKVELDSAFANWWMESDGATVYFGYKELQFFSISEMVGEDIYKLQKHMPCSIPLCLDGNGNICVAKIQDCSVSGIYVVDCGDLSWESSVLISANFNGFLNDRVSPEARLNA